MHLIPSLLTASILLSIVLYCIIGGSVNYNKLKQFPGPPLAGCSKIWLWWQSINKRVHIAQFEAIKKYGSPCRIGPDVLVINDADMIRHMSAPRSMWRRGPWYEAMRLDPRRDSVFSTRDEKIHADLRSQMMGAYSGRDIDTIEPVINDMITELIELIHTKYNRKSMDLSAVARFFTLDVLSSIAFSSKFGYMQANHDMYDFVKESSAFVSILELTLNHDFFRKLIASNFVQKLAGPKTTDKTGFGPLLLHAHKAVSERFTADAKPKKDMLGFMVSKGMSQEQCEVEAFLQIIAGSDSTTTILRSTMFLLAGTPRAYAKLRAEIDEVVITNESSGVLITYREALELPYLRAVLWEGIRMFPPLFGLKAKVAPRGGDTFNGIFYPAGTQIAICDDALCRNKAVFGDDADIFRPDRWIEADEQTRARYERVVDTIFGANKWSCLGKHIAMVELYKTLFELIRHFDWAMTDPMRGIDTFAHAIHFQTNMNVVATPRD